MDESPTFNPLDKYNLAESIAKALLKQPACPLPPERFPGAGIYLVYFRGSFAPYAPLARMNRTQFVWPIYVGKAEPKGSRKGGESLDALPGNVLHARLADHAASIEAVSSTLCIEDFACRWLPVDDVFIRLGERLLIARYRPVWNLALDGFGNHAVGSGRERGKRPTWDTVHPGRKWAERLEPSRSVDELLARVAGHFRDHPPQRKDPII